ncbi:hypothetical protein NDU88_005607 [Pleurodeles waltl]|uniref:Uncharacterized protein n=1 Tax=Pleurodeles waltl TaxID=8319 RepID=A0AAV7UKL9_PLEWA|nr:hypothetical protein NDU88_005607 [Pleurodeles waltl]
MLKGVKRLQITALPQIAQEDLCDIGSLTGRASLLLAIQYLDGESLRVRARTEEAVLHYMPIISGRLLETRGGAVHACLRMLTPPLRLLGPPSLHSLEYRSEELKKVPCNGPR